MQLGSIWRQFQSSSQLNNGIVKLAQLNVGQWRHRLLGSLRLAKRHAEIGKNLRIVGMRGLRLLQQRNRF